MPLHQTQQNEILKVEGLKKVFRSGSSDLVLFENLSFHVAAGEMLAVVGQSGAGKSTLLHMIGALDTPTAGRVFVAGQEVTRMPPDRAADLRNREIGYVWQFHYLLPEFTALENVAMPLLMRGIVRRDAEAEARHWLSEVELHDRGHHRTGELSGGEQQRVALARALITRPKLLLADEPTGDLDMKTSEAVFALLTRLHASYGLSSLIVTHNLSFAARCGRAMRLTGGRLEEVQPESLQA